jgi:protein-S-isoprenylcysteine O-methyltransferase Ste14
MVDHAGRILPFAESMRALTNSLLQDFLGGPKLLKLSWVINFQKAGTFFFIGLLMWIYQNAEPVVWIYLALHGSYGLCWILKDNVFPDSGWQVRVTFGGAFMAFALVLGWYWVIPWLLVSGVSVPDYPIPEAPWLAFCITLHTLGIAIMLISDCQKYFSLKAGSNLITTGMFRYIRHPNYLGEMMIYSSYALIVFHWLPWVILAWVWLGIFSVNILLKEKSLSRYPEWTEYESRTGLLLPAIKHRT